MDNSLNDQRNNVLSLLFRVQARLCALPVAQVVEIMRPLPVEPIAGAPLAVKGVAVVRGVPLPVVDLAILLGGTATIPARFVTVRSGSSHIVLAVDSVLGLRGISAASLRELPALLGEADNKAVAAIGTLDTELLLLLNSTRLLSNDAWSVFDAAGASR